MNIFYEKRIKGSDFFSDNIFDDVHGASQKNIYNEKLLFVFLKFEV